MPVYKLIYFACKGRGELVRLLLSIADQEFEDVRITEEAWPEYKSKTPFEQLPLLAIDGKEMSQSGAMHRYLAREFGLYGKNNSENTQCDVVLETVQDVQTEFSNHFYAFDDIQKKEDIAKNILENFFPKFLKFMDKLIKDNGAGYLVGSELTVADLAYFDIQDRLKTNIGDCKEIENYPDLLKLVEKVQSIPSIKKWLNKRPNTDL
ncbi:HPGDS [Mytilus coruscus]|uniref:glutathione transferase n=1 Tax=Mytilus coruscus TaxID=42192 RepID=A0A6J8E568_MYTCO|nr:HPGDS [Mytilus coruscus]